MVEFPSLSNQQQFYFPRQKAGAPTCAQGSKSFWTVFVHAIVAQPVKGVNIMSPRRVWRSALAAKRTLTSPTGGDSLSQLVTLVPCQMLQAACHVQSIHILHETWYNTTIKFNPRDEWPRTFARAFRREWPIKCNCLKQQLENLAKINRNTKMVKPTVQPDAKNLSTKLLQVEARSTWGLWVHPIKCLATLRSSLKT